LWKSNDFHKERKRSKKKERRTVPYGKVENAKSAFPTFPQGLLPERRRKKRPTGDRTKVVGGLSAASILSPDPRSGD
jgi:hypothetical protein